MLSIMKHKLSNAILQVQGNKASSLDGIPNCILHLALFQILPLLLPLYNQCLHDGTHLKAFKHSITVILQKPNKGNYRVAKTYRLVALLNTLEKALESVVARRMS